jgi:hypothetical protein
MNGVSVIDSEAGDVARRQLVMVAAGVATQHSAVVTGWRTRDDARHVLLLTVVTVRSTVVLQQRE